MSEIINLKPECIWRNFDALTQVPRPSGQREEIHKFLLDFAAKAGVEAFQDAGGNIIMRKPATPGMENRKGVILQAHMDMVPQKSKDSTHDFKKDPIETYIDGEWVKARNTTLGADNGIVVAAVMVTIKGLKGGHSGLEINEGRGNANKLMARFVHEAISQYEARLASWNGGTMRNAIPFECETVLTLPKENVEALKESVEQWRELFNNEYHTIENEIKFFAEEVATPATETPEEIQDNLLDAIYACHNGVLRMIPVFPTVVETSSNLAIVNIADGKAAIKILARSSKEDMRDYIATSLERCFSMAGMKVEQSGAYGGWDPNTESELLKLLEKNYRELFGEEAVEQVDHAGLECSVILDKYPHLEVVSLGPTLRSPHTTAERCLIPTVAPFWELLKKTLEEVPAK